MVDFRLGIDKSILNLDIVKKELDNAEVYEDEDGNKIQTIYLGSMIKLTPSGKVYMPWAHSNVDECTRCGGTGQIKNKHGKKKKYETTYKKHTLIIKTIRNRGNEFIEWKKHSNLLKKLTRQEEWWNTSASCPECAGMGSLEARLDEDWWEQLQSELDTIGAWHHGSEGDGCDVMISRATTDQEDEIPDGDDEDESESEMPDVRETS